MYPKYSCGTWTYSNGVKSHYSPEELIERNKELVEKNIKLERRNEELENIIKGGVGSGKVSTLL